MKLKLTILLILISNISLAQDTSRYCQKNLTPYGSNCYSFYKNKKTDTVGRFERFQGFDDGQDSYGKGEFIESKKTIKLKPYQLITTHQIIKLIIKNGVPDDTVLNGKRDTLNLKDGELLHKHNKELYDYYRGDGKHKKQIKIYYEPDIKR